MVIRNILAGFLLTAGIASSLPVAAVGNTSPIGVGLFPPLQIPNTEFSIKGLRFGLIGVNREAHGLDIALLGNVTKQMFSGIAIAGLFNYNSIGAEIIGLQLTTIANINGTGSKLYGLQVGAYNKVSKVYGIQIGLINVAHELHGIQIGIINFNESGPFKVTPIINAAF